MATFTLADPERRWRWLDLRSPATFADFRHRFASALDAFGYRDYDLAAASSDERGLTRPIGLWAYQKGYHGIRYPTRHDPDLNCWAIFSVVDGARIIEIEDVPLLLDDLDLRWVATNWDIPLPA